MRDPVMMQPRRSPVFERATRYLCGDQRSAPAWLRVLLLAVVLAGCKEMQATETTLEISPAGELSLQVGGVRQLTALGGGRSVTWSSSNEAVATVVAQTGYVQAVGRGTATITATSASTSASITVTVLAPPTLALSTPLLDIEAVLGGPDPGARTVTVSNAGDGAIGGLALGTIEWGDGQPVGWLTVTASATSAPATLTFTARLAGLPRGTYTAAVPVLANGVANSPQFVAVTFRVLAPAAIVLSRTAVPMQGIPGMTLVENVNITNSGDVALTGLDRTVTYAGAAQGWLSTTLGATAPTTLVLTANTAGLAPGNYSATVRLTSTVTGVASRDVAVQLTVNPGPSILLASASVTTNATLGTNAAPLTISISNGGGGTLSSLSLGSVTYGNGQPAGWLNPSISGAVAPANLTLNFSTIALPTGTYNATVTLMSVVASNSPVTLPVTLIVGPAPSIVLSRSTVPMSGQPSTTQVETVNITSSSGVPLSGLTATTTYTAGQPQGWLATSLSATTSPSTLTLTGMTGSMAPGTYTATVRIASTIVGVAPRDVSVQLTVVPNATILLSSNPVAINASFGINPTPVQIGVTNGGGGTLTNLSLGTVNYSSGPSGWLTPSLNQTAAPATITLMINSAALASGNHTATVPVISNNAANSPVNLVVNLTVAAAPVLAVNPLTLNFAAWANQTIPALPGAQVANVTNSGGGTLNGLFTSVQYTGGGQVSWITTTLNSSTAPTTVSIRPSRTNLPAGTHTAAVTISSTIPGVAPRTINVTYTVQSFSVSLYPFFQSAGCAGCHSGSQAPKIVGNNAATDYASLFSRVSAGNPAGSTLYCKISGGCAHGGGSFGSTFVAAVAAWITVGAPF